MNIARNSRASRAARVRPLLLSLAAIASTALAGETYPLHVHGDRLFIDVAVNGVPHQALLDSGAEMSLLDDDVARALKLEFTRDETAKGSGGETPVRMVEGLTLEATGVKLENRPAAVLDLADISKRLVGRDVAMVLGREFFDAGRFEIDIEGATIKPLDRSQAPAGVRLPLTTAHGIESVPIQIEQHTASADFDLGNGSEMMIGKAFAEELGVLNAERTIERKQGGGVGGAVERDVVRLASVEIAGVRFENVRAAVDALPNAGEANIGVKLLRSFLIVTDFPQKAVWLRPRDAGEARQER